MSKKIYQIFIPATLLAASLLGLSACSDVQATHPDPTPTAVVTPTPTPVATPEPTPEPVEIVVELTPEPVVEPTPEPTPEPFSPVLEERERANDDFFADAAFFGNSLVDGLRYYGGIESASFYAATSASVVNVEMTHNVEVKNGDPITLFQALTKANHGKIYILLGINEISFEPSYFGELYGQLIDRIREHEPEAELYIMSLSPVTEKCSEDSGLFNMERIRTYNEVIFSLAEEKECYYVDLCEALADEDGFLPEEDSTKDGIHLKKEKYPQWAEYLRTHYAGDGA